MCTWSAEYPNKLRRAAAIIADRDDVTQWTLLVFPNGAKNIDKVIGRASTREDDDTLCFEAAVTEGHWREHGGVGRKGCLGKGGHDDARLDFGSRGMRT
jgi:hypothetical protein